MANKKPKKLVGFEFRPFSAKQLKVLNWWADDSPVKDRRMMIADGSIRAGKAQPVDSILFTPNGMKKMGEVKINDYVFGRDGKPTRVLDVFPQGKKDVYRVTFQDGSCTECCKEHLWTYTTQKCILNKNYTMFTSTLEDIMTNLNKLKDKKHMFQRAGRYKFPISCCVNFNKREIKIDPYLLGLLIGDGCFSEGNSGITFINEDSELHEYINNILPRYEMRYIYKPRVDNHCSYGRLANEHGTVGKTKLRALLEGYGLYGKKSETKFIPDDYKFNSEDVRLHILAGLLNTDGNACWNRSSMRYSTTSKRLLDDVAFLARSLGMFVSTDRKPDMRDKNKNICYSCSIRLNNNIYNLLLKKHIDKLNMNPVKDEIWRIIKSIDYIGKKECQCILVDNDEHLYLTDDFIVTHNTVAITLSFVLYVMKNFNYQNAAISGKSVGAVRRNILSSLQSMLISLGYDWIEHRSENYIEIIKGDRVNSFYLFGLVL